MSKRTKRILWCIPLAATVLLAVLVGVYLADKDVSLGRFVSGCNGGFFAVLDSRTAPVQMHYDPVDCEPGDRIFILHRDAFAESYPEQGWACLVLKIGNGTLEDVPQAALDVLHELGYI